MSGLGRRVPTDWVHVDRYPLRAVQPETVQTVETVLYRPGKSWRQFYDQGQEGACVGFGSSECMSILNHARYDARWLWDRAKEVDEWPDTNPGDDNGTSVRAAMDVLRDKGHVRVVGGRDKAPNPADGIAANRWATTVDEIRTCIANGVPVVIGVNWYSLFDNPISRPMVRGGRGEWWIDPKGDLGSIRGGHCVCLIGASDSRQAVRFPNSWGLNYPITWMPYAILQRLIQEDGEATVIVDR
jgi:hypothetical protein